MTEKPYGLHEPEPSWGIPLAPLTGRPLFADTWGATAQAVDLYCDQHQPERYTASVLVDHGLAHAVGAAEESQVLHNPGEALLTRYVFACELHPRQRVPIRIDRLAMIASTLIENNISRLTLQMLRNVAANQ